MVRGAAVNQDGHTSSMTVPSVDGQAAMLEDAYRQAGILPARVVYVEAHGTGTPVGDPIEATALGRVLGRGRAPESGCPIGLGEDQHRASGVGVRNRRADQGRAGPAPPDHPGDAQSRTSESQPFRFDDLRLEVVTRTLPLPADDAGLPPVAGVNSFGFGGTNAHVVLEGAPVNSRVPCGEGVLARVTRSSVSASCLGP